jgi:hypothetical protein
MEKAFNPNFLNKNEIPFIADDDCFPDSSLHYHHEPRLAEDSHELVNEALEVRQNDFEVLDRASKERFLKTYGIGPCVLFVASHSNQEQLVVIHFDAKSDIEGLIEAAKKKIGIKSFDGFRISTIGGIKEMKASEELVTNLKRYLFNQGTKADYDSTLSLAESDYKGFYDKDFVPLLAYQCLIMDKKTGDIFSFDPSSDKIKKS